MKRSEIRKQADKIVKYLSPEYLALNRTVRLFAEPHILFNGFYVNFIGNRSKVADQR